VVIAPGDAEAYRDAAGPLGNRLHFVEQIEPLGYADAVLRAAPFVAGEPFLHLVGDHLYLSGSAVRCARQVVEVAKVERCSVSAVQATREAMLPYYGTVGARRVARRSDLYEVTTVREKPTPSEAEQTLTVTGIRGGYYLCFFGIHVLTPTAMELLASVVADAKTPLPLSTMLQELAQRERYLALEVVGSRTNIGVKYGLLAAQLSLALNGVDRDRTLTMMVDLLAHRG
jgi:UTP--glucose-1-phosphate uridylyltransferase